MVDPSLLSSTTAFSIVSVSVRVLKGNGAWALKRPVLDNGEKAEVMWAHTSTSAQHRTDFIVSALSSRKTLEKNQARK
jgi:hypothetical protein